MRSASFSRLALPLSTSFALTLLAAGSLALGAGCGGSVDFTVPDDGSVDGSGDTGGGDSGGGDSAACPAAEPTSGTSCTPEGLACTYPSGCATPTSARCTSGKWAVAIPECPQPVPSCPASIPTNKGACPKIGLVCAYGDDPRPQCRTSATCTNTGWEIGLTGCPPPPTVTCPATATAAEGQSCTKEGAICTYSGGTVVCGCSACAGGPCGTNPTWHCAQPPIDGRCPKLMPNLGTTCTVSGVECDYGSCSAGTIAGRKCDGTIWVDVPMACPA
jgi:hypothetical protein